MLRFDAETASDDDGGGGRILRTSVHRWSTNRGS